MDSSDQRTRCGCGPSGCGPAPLALDRRGFLQLAAAAAAAPAMGRLPVMAGPFEDNEYLRTIPADKRLDPAWVRSLYERRAKQIYADPQALAHIGMPVGGLFAGTVYLSGDGRLWLWDIFNRDQEGILPREVTPPDSSMTGGFVRGGANYVHPAPVTQPFDVGWTLDIEGRQRTLDAAGFAQVTFDGRYPIGRVAYRDPNCPLAIDLEAFSPFIPLNVEDSSLPATVLSYRLTNTSDAAVTGVLRGRLANPICLETRDRVAGRRVNRVRREQRCVAVEFAAEPLQADDAAAAPRPDISIDDFEAPEFRGWEGSGTAFGGGPTSVADVPDYQGDLNAEGTRVVNSHASAPGDDIAAKDAQTGRLVSRAFAVERHYLSLLVGGGAQPGATCVNLLIDGVQVASLTGENANAMRRRSFHVAQYEGREARLEIVDAATGGWGNIGVDDIVLTDVPPEAAALEQQRDFGTMTLALLEEPGENRLASAQAGGAVDAAAAALSDDSLTGMVERRFTLPAGATLTVDFAVTWHFPNFYARGCGNARTGHWYAEQFPSALAVAEYLAEHRERLLGTTRQWVDAWYDASLPYWLLDRTLATASTLATTTCYRFADGRFWAWEGIGCCEGTCTHVWHYAQAPGRLFPSIERDTRRRVDFDLALHDDGGIGHRANLQGPSHPADDGQCGRILGVYREHLMSPDEQFLREIWPQVKRALEYLIRKDDNADGMIEGAQPNTLDAAWYGKISFLASLYLAALRSGEQMARLMGDDSFAEQCAAIAQRGADSILATYNGEYFTQIEDPAFRHEIGVGPGCYIDQTFGQTWAHWTDLGTLFDRDKQLSALRAVWKYNFVPDLGPFRERFPRGRWYAMAGDAGLIMCSWPRGGQNPAFKDHWQYMYFNECMTGFEWQAAAHMIWEGRDQPDLLQYGLAVSRAIHDRYDASLRNPYNEIECSDHYARSMASYGVFQAVCGFQCDGPRRRLEFAPRLSPEDFRAAFVGPTGWGTFAQQARDGQLRVTLTLKYGELALEELVVHWPQACARIESPHLAASFAQEGERIVISLPAATRLGVGEDLEFALRIA